MIRRESIDWKVVGKETSKSWLFGTTYYIILKAAGDTARAIVNDVTTKREVPMEQYYSVDEGDLLTLNMYTRNGHTFFFKAEEVN